MDWMKIWERKNGARDMWEKRQCHRLENLEGDVSGVLAGIVELGGDWAKVMAMGDGFDRGLGEVWVIEVGCWAVG